MMRRLCVSRQTGEGQLYMRDGRIRRISEGPRSRARLGPDFACEVERSFGIDRMLVTKAREAVAEASRRYSEKGRRGV